MYKILNDFDESKIKYIALHHTGGVFGNIYHSTQNLTANQVDSIHKDRWPNFISSMGYYGGYNFFIEKNGKLTQFRAIGEETAAIKGHNKDTIHIALAGNFLINPETNKKVNKPTPEQLKTLDRLTKEIKIGFSNVFRENYIPHRILQNTKCYGSLKDNWFRKFVFFDIDYEKKELEKQLYNLYFVLIDLLRQILLKTKGSLASDFEMDCVDYGDVRG